MGSGEGRAGLGRIIWRFRIIRRFHPYPGIFRDKGVQKERNGGADYHAARRELTARRSATNKTPSYW